MMFDLQSPLGLTMALGPDLVVAIGAMLLLIALGVLFYAIVQLRTHDYVAAILLVVTGLSLLRAGTELLRPTVGE